MLAGRPCSSPSQTLRASLLADPCCLHATACEKGNHHTCSSPGVYRTNKGTASVTPRQPSRVMLYDDVISSRSGSTKALRELMQLPAREPEATRPAQKRKACPADRLNLQLTAAAVEGAGIWLCRDTCRTMRMVGRDINAGDMVIFFTHFTAHTSPSRAQSAYDVLFCIS